MMDPHIHGVALIKVGAGPINPVEFYGVFFRGALQPTKYANWIEADRTFRRMETRAETNRGRVAEHQVPA